MSEENNGEGQENAATQAILPESFKEVPALADFKDVETLGKAFTDLKAYQGQSIRIPGTDAGDTQMQEFRQKIVDVEGVMLKPDFTNDEQSTEFFRTLGRPDNIEGYEFDSVEGYTPNEDKFKAFKELALSNNLTKAQASRMAKTMMEQDLASSSAMKEAQKANVATLKADWGHAYDQNSQIAVKIAKATGAPEAVVDAMESGQMDSNFTKWMHSLASKFEGEGRNLVPANETRVDTPDEIRGQISDIMNNTDHPYWNATHPDHKESLDKMLALQRKLH